VELELSPGSTLDSNELSLFGQAPETQNQAGNSSWTANRHAQPCRWDVQDFPRGPDQGPLCPQEVYLGGGGGLGGGEGEGGSEPLGDDGGEGGLQVWRHVCSSSVAGGSRSSLW
jgi:hypothetical protein